MTLTKKVFTKQDVWIHQWTAASKQIATVWSLYIPNCYFFLTFFPVSQQFLLQSALSPLLSVCDRSMLYPFSFPYNCILLVIELSWSPRVLLIFTSPLANRSSHLFCDLLHHCSLPLAVFLLLCQMLLPAKQSPPLPNPHIWAVIGFVLSFPYHFVNKPNLLQFKFFFFLNIFWNIIFLCS